MWSSPGDIVASTQMLDVGRSLIFTAPFLPPHVVQPTGVAASIPDPGPGPHRIEMLWWRRDAGVHELLSVANSSAASLQLSYAVTGSSGAALPAQMITLGPHQSQLIDLAGQIAQLPQYLASTGGITISYQGVLGQLLVSGLLENDAEGYSDHMPYAFHDPGTERREYRYAATGMLAGQPAPALGFRSNLRFFPYLVLRNTSAGSLDVDVTVNWEPEGSDDGTGAGSVPNQSYALPPLRFAPGASTQVDMQGVLHAAGLDGFDGSVNLLVSYTGHEGDLVMGAGSVDQSGSFVFAVLPEPVRRSFGRRASYWAIGGGYDTMITLWNTGSTPEDILVRLRYADGTGRYTVPVHLAPMSSRVIDLWQLIASGRADHGGRQFNVAEQTGSISFESATSHTTWLHLNADIAVYNSKNGTCGCYCDPCCAYDNFSMSPATLLLDINGKETIQPFGCYCNGQQDVLEVDITTNDAGVVTVNGVQVTGVGVGQTTVTVTFAPVVQGGVNCYGAYNTSNCYSAPAILHPPPTATVTPTVAINCPTSVLIVGSGSGAYDTQETCTATGTPSGGTYSWAILGNSSAASISASGASATATAVSQSKSAGDAQVNVEYTFNGEKVEQASPTTVRDPSGLTVVSDSGTEQDYNCAENGLANYTCGDQRSIQYEVTDGLGAVTVAGIPLTEVFAPGTNTCDATMRSRGGTTSSNGYFGAPDHLAMCSAVCSTGTCPPPGSCTLDETQQWYANGLLVRTNSLTYECTNILVNGK